MTVPSFRRRSFLARLSASSAAFAAAIGVPVALQGQSQAPPAANRDTHELDKWLDDLTGKHRQVFDCVSKAHIAEMMYAGNFLRASVSDYGLTNEDMSVIVSLRHEATVYGYNDAMWANYRIGEVLDIDAPRGEGKAVQNPQASLITSLAGRGVQFTVCALATTRYAGDLARAAGLQAADVRADLLANLVPNCRPVAAGVVVLNRAQERGFSYIHVG